MSSTTIKIMELSNTWGCVWKTTDGKIQYGFSNAPVSQKAKAWLGMTSGDAVTHLIKTGLGRVTETHPGAYGGTKRTIQVNVDRLNTACAAYWKQAERAETKRQEQSGSCHYCGCEATGIGFFDEPVCPECGGPER